eukprot:4906129-Pyramimonas_sp.AAC.1
MAECCWADANAGPEANVPIVGGHPMADDGAPNPRPPAPLGVLQPRAAKVFMKIFFGAGMARCDLLRAACTLASC